MHPNAQTNAVTFRAPILHSLSTQNTGNNWLCFLSPCQASVLPKSPKSSFSLAIRNVSLVLPDFLTLRGGKMTCWGLLSKEWGPGHRTKTRTELHPNVYGKRLDPALHARCCLLRSQGTPQPMYSGEYTGEKHTKLAFWLTRGLRCWQGIDQFTGQASAFLR